MKNEGLLIAALALLTINLSVFAGEVVDAAYVAEALKRDAIVWDVRGEDEYANGHIPGDTRSHKEFTGEDIHALRGGHIPGACNIPFEQNWVDPDAGVKLAKRQVKTCDGMALKSASHLKALYASLDPSKETIVYCHSGGRASETATVLRSLGFEKVRVFEESWLGYGNDLSAPAESVQFFNIGILQSRIRNLETEIENLKAEVKALRAAAAVGRGSDPVKSDQDQGEQYESDHR